jgi:hypothetical protein
MSVNRLLETHQTHQDGDQLERESHQVNPVR